MWGVWGSLPTLPNLQYFFWTMNRFYNLLTTFFWLWIALTSNCHRTDKQTLGILGKPPNPSQLKTFFFTMNRFYNLLTTFLGTMNSFDFKLAQDRQTNTGDSGEAPQPFPTDNIFLLWIYWKQVFWLWTVIVQTATDTQTNRHCIL